MFHDDAAFSDFEPFAHVPVFRPVRSAHGENPIASIDDVANFEFVGKPFRPPPLRKDRRIGPCGHGFGLAEGEGARGDDDVVLHGGNRE